METGEFYHGVLIEQDTTFDEHYMTEMGCDSIVTVVIDVTGVGVNPLSDNDIQLRVFPNPLRAEVVMEYQLAEVEEVEIKLYHSSGKLIGVLLEEQRKNAGIHSHRFALTGHRARRGKTRKQSSLDEIPGIGPKRRKALLTHFGGLKQLRNASAGELARVPGINAQMAQTLYDWFHD